MADPLEKIMAIISGRGPCHTPLPGTFAFHLTQVSRQPAFSDKYFSSANKFHSRWPLAFFIASLTILCLSYPGAKAAAASSSGIRSAAVTGRPEYLAHCAGCHGEKLGGGFGPPLRSNEFRSKWATMSSAALVRFIDTTMPPQNPGGLSTATYKKIAAYLRSSNGLANSGNIGKQASERPVRIRSEYKSGGVGEVIPNKDAFYRWAVARRRDKLANLPPVTEAMLRKPPPGDWLQWRRTYNGHGFTPLDQITSANVDKLSVAWAKALPPGSNEITPLVYDGVMFIDSAGTVEALDVSSGGLLWQYKRSAKITQMGPPVSQPKSMAIYGDLLYVPTIDDHIIALKFRSGAVVWDHVIQKTKGILRMTAAPIVVHGKVIQGTTGCIMFIAPHGCFIVGLDARTGHELWRFYTIPGKGKPGGDTWSGAPDDERIGGGVWDAGTYDPQTNLVYFGTGNAYHIAPLLLPDNKVSHANAGLYTDTTLALDPDTGKLVWHYQHMRRDVWDLDWSFEQTLLTIKYQGAKRSVVATMGKLGILDVLDAKTGQYLFSYDVGMQNLVTKINPRTGRKVTNPKMEPRPGHPVHVCPFSIGVRNWPATSYDPTRGLLFVPLGASCMELAYNKGKAALDISYSPRPDPRAHGKYGRFMAIDVAEGTAAWTARYRAPVMSAALATAGGIVFEGGRNRWFRALDSDTGKLLWRIRLDNVPSASPISFSYKGAQYVAITTGGGNPNDITRASLTPEIEPAVRGTTLWVFKLRSK